MFFRLKRYKDFVGQVDYYNKYILRSYVKSRFSSFLRSNYIQMQKSRDFCWEIKKYRFLMRTICETHMPRLNHYVTVKSEIERRRLATTKPNV